MLKHFIYTRNRYPADHPGLAQRVALLRHITLPGLRGQTNGRFTWLLNGRQGLEEADFDGLDVQIVADFRQHMHAALAADPAVDRVISTRLDNDDFLLPGFVAAVQRRAEGESCLLIDAAGYRCDLRSGLLYEDRLYRATFPSPFLSVLEVANGQTLPRFAFIDYHRHMHRHFPVAPLTERLWVQTLHGNNRLNGDDDLKETRSRCVGPLVEQAAGSVGLQAYAAAAALLTDSGTSF